MNSFEVVLTSAARDDIRQLERSVRERLIDKLHWMGQNAALLVHQPLKGDEWDGAYKYRLGGYRIIYRLDVGKRQLIVLKVDIGARCIKGSIGSHRPQQAESIVLI